MHERFVLFCIVVLLTATAANAQVVTQSYRSLEYEFFDSINDSRVSAGGLLSGGLYPPSYYTAVDVDYYRIDVSSVPSTLTVHVDGVGTIFFMGDPEVWLENNTGGVLAHNDDIAPTNFDCFLIFVFQTPGDYYVRVEHSALSSWNYNASNYTLWGDYQFVDLDEEMPTYDGGVGVRSALRLSRDRYRSAYVAWSPATDNRTPANEMKYNVYYAATSETVFSGAAAASFVGDLAGIVSGLSSDPAVDVWFGVRAEDSFGNEEQNDIVVLADVPLAVRPSHWTLYR